MKIALLSSLVASWVSSPVASLEITLINAFSNEVSVAGNVNSSDFSLLSQALAIAELDDVLDGEGPFTLFAPPDEAIFAFAAYSPGTINRWLAESPPTTLTEVLLYHVFAGEVLEVKGKEVGDDLVLEMANSETTTLSANQLMIEDANIIMADIEASNGKIEIIDSLLIPPNVTVLPGLLFVANATGEFGNFLGLVESLNLTVEFFHPEPHTLIAPTDDAFAKLGSITDDVETLLYVIDSHIVPGTFDAASLFDGQVLRTLSGVNLTVSVNNETGISIAGSTVVSPDLFASNGVIHGIDTIILPVSSDPPTPSPHVSTDPVASASSVSFCAAIVLGLFAMMV